MKLTHQTKRNLIVSSFVLILLMIMVGLIININSFDSTQTYAKTAPQSPSLELSIIGPPSTEPGVPFQVQKKSGESAIWIKGNNITNTTKIMWQKTELKTTYGDTKTLVAIVPKPLYANAGKYDIYLYDTKTKATSNKLVFTVEKALPLKLTQMGPSSTKANQLFQVQKNGVSAIWVVGEGFTRNTKVVWEKTRLQTFHKDSTTLTAFVPKSLIAKPGNYSISLFDIKTNAKSNSLIFIVQK